MVGNSVSYSLKSSWTEISLVTYNGGKLHSCDIIPWIIECVF